MNRLFLLCCSAALCFIFTSCAVGPDYTTPELATPDHFTGQNGSGIQDGSEETAPHDWWAGFGDATLQSLIQSTAEGNKDIAIALTRVDESRAIARETRAQLFPGLQLRGIYDSEQVSGARFPNGEGGFTFETWTGAVDVGWEVDLFGRLRRAKEGRNAEFDAAIYGVEDALRVVMADVATTYFELRRTQADYAITKENIEIQTRTLGIVQDRRDAGSVSDFDLARARAQLSATKATLPPLEAAIKGAIHRLSVLSGKAPTELASLLATASPVPVYRGPLTLTQPKELLRRRPDLRAAERNLAASSAFVGAAIGDLYPVISFSGSLGVEAKDPHDLNNGAGTFSIMPKILWTPLDNSSIHARIAAAGARKDRAFLTYEQTLLRALEETENALAQFAAERSRRNDLEDSVAASKKAYELAELQYSSGAVDLLTVLNVETTLLIQQSALAQSEANLASSLVAIYKALGGGWEDNVVTEPDTLAAAPKA